MDTAMLGLSAYIMKDGVRLSCLSSVTLLKVRGKTHQILQLHDYKNKSRSKS